MTNDMTKVEHPSITGTTSMLDPGRAGAPLHTMDAILALRVYGTEHELPLPLTRSFVIGGGTAADVRIPKPVAERKVSRQHARLTRAGEDGASWLKVEDLDSSNGTSFGGVRRGGEFAVSAGQRFAVAHVELMVMNKLLMRMRQDLGGFVGFRDHHRLDCDIVDLPDLPLLIVGPTGSERGQLAKDLHRSSPRRHRRPVEIKDWEDGAQVTKAVKAAAGGMVYVMLDPLGPKAKLATLVSQVLDRSNDVWPILIAPSWEHASMVLNSSVGLFHLIKIPPIESRGPDVLPLLDMMLADQGSAYRVAALDPDRQAAMTEYAWPRHRTELRQTAARLAALIHCKFNLTAAAAMIGEHYDTLRDALLRVGAITARARGRGA